MLHPVALKGIRGAWTTPLALALCSAIFFGCGHGVKPASSSQASVEASPVGLWTTPDRKTKIRIAKCGGKMCGTVAWVEHPLRKNGEVARDDKNPKSGLRSRTIVGMPLMGGFTQSNHETKLWENGWIYDPQSGKTYSANITVEGAQGLRLHGYVGLTIIGGSQLWTRIGRG